MSQRASTRSVAIVNGNTELLRRFQDVLGAGHYEISFIESSDEAYSRIKREQPSLVVLFMRIDDPADFQALSMLKLDPATSDIPVLTYVAPCDVESASERMPSSHNGVFVARSAPLMN
jgi:DNA-binding NtrC family response regulator